MKNSVVTTVSAALLLELGCATAAARVWTFAIAMGSVSVAAPEILLADSAIREHHTIAKADQNKAEVIDYLT